MYNCDVCIIGGGAIGMFLASKFILNNQSVVIIESNDFLGGQLNLYREKKIYNLPLIDSITSAEIINKLTSVISNNENCKILFNSNIVDIKKDDFFELKIKNKNDIENNICCKYLVFAYGKGVEEPNKILLDCAKNFENKTLFYSVENEDLFKDKNIVIAGGGDSVIDWTCELVKIAKNITIVHRRAIEKPENQQFLTFKKLQEQGKIIVKTSCNIIDLKGKNDILENIIITNYDKQNENIKCDYLLAFYGLKTSFNGLEVYKKIGVNFTQNNKINVNNATNQTDIENVFAVGDCCFFEGKIENILMGFADCMKCFYNICGKEKGKIDIYEHK